MTSISGEEMLAKHADRVEQIKTAAGTEQRVWEYFYRPFLVRFGEYVQQLPLSRTVYRDVNGAFEYGLVTSMVALNYADSQAFFPDSTSEDRRLLKPQCNFAAFVATLASCVAELAQNACIRSEDKEREYYPLTSVLTLQAWLEANPGAELSWRGGNPIMLDDVKPAIGAKFIPNSLFGNFDLRVVDMLYGAILPILKPNDNGVETTLARVVRQSRTKVADHYLEQVQKRYDSSTPIAVPSIADVNSMGTGLTQAAQPPQIAKTKSDDEEDAPSADQNKGMSPEVAPAAPAAKAPDATIEIAMHMIKDAHQDLREWLINLRKHENFKMFVDHLEESAEGIAIQITMLGKVCDATEPTKSATGIRNHLTKTPGLLIARSPDAKKYIVSRNLKPFFSIA